MPDLLVSTAPLALAPGIFLRAAPVALPETAASAPDFAQLLGALVPPQPMLPGKGGGKEVAGPGNDLPVEAPGAEEDEEDGPLIAWLPGQPLPLPDEASLPGIALVVVPEAVATVPLAPPILRDAMALPVDGADATTTAGAEAEIPPGEQPALPDDGPETQVADATADPSDPIPALRTRFATVPAQAEPGIGRGVAATPEARLARTVGVAVPEAPRAAPPLATQPAAPAAQVFAAALAAPLSAPADPLDTAPRTPEPGVIESQAARIAETQRTTVQAMTQADRAPLDLGRDDWTGKMIDRIAMLRDAAEATDTRIRLAPEHLGTVEVSIRREGDRIQVHFTAENPATRQLLAEAAPRLAELAEARGVKLGQTSVDGGGGQGARQDAPHSDSNRSARPASAARAMANPAPDERIA